MRVSGQPCPRCGGMSWYEWNQDSYVQRCLCGLLRYVIEEVNGSTITHVQTNNEMVLPRAGTKLSDCLGLVASYHPQNINTKTVAILMKQKVNAISAQLMVLMHKGLVQRVESNRGKEGGSIWSLTRRATKRLNLLEGL